MSPTTVPAGSADASADSPVYILVVDDEPRNLAVLESVLNDPSYRLVRAGSGNDALLALVAHDFAVLVLDVRMPDMTGFELAQIVKGRRKTARIPIIFLTAYYNEDQHVIEGYSSGAVDYLHKPVNPAVLRSKVAVFAELHRKTLALERGSVALMHEVAEHRRTESLLNELNATLDQRIAERTQALHASQALLQEADRRKDEFLATLAHELRNPLAPMRNAAQILRLQGTLTPDAMWAAEIIERQIQSMSRLVEDLMDAARISQGRIELRPQRVAMAQVLRDAVEACRPFIDECAHQLALDMGAVDVCVVADRIRLAQAFTNLLHNAAKYTNHGGAIEVRVTQLPDTVRVTVQDSGIGLSADRLHSIFGMFSQVESTLDRARGGLGIGLALTQHLVELHGGSITASSAGLGRGSAFEVHLPLATETPQPVPEATPPPSEQKAEHTVRILIADDNEDSLNTLAFLLEAMGHVVCQAGDGEAAVAKVADFDPDLVLLDIGMPKLSGYEVCRRIRALDGAHKRTIVAVTGWGQAHDKWLAQEAGFDQHLVKPLGPEELDSVLSRIQPADVPVR